MFVQWTDKLYIDWGKKVGVFKYSEYVVQIVPLTKNIFSISEFHIILERLRPCLHNQPSVLFSWLEASPLEFFIQPVDNVSNTFNSLFTSIRFGFGSVKFFLMVSFSREWLCSKLLWKLNISNSKEFKSFDTGINHHRLDNFRIWIAFQKNDRHLNYFTHPSWNFIYRYVKRPSSIFCWFDEE